MPGASSPDIDAYRAMQFKVDPTIGARLGEAQRGLKDQFINPTGGYVTPSMKDAITRSQTRELFQQGGAQTRAGQYDVNSLNLQKAGNLAALTAPPLVQTGSSGTSSGTSSSTDKFKTPFSAKIMPALQSGAQAAAAGMGGG